MDPKTGRELCFKVIEMAKKAGVQQCDVIMQRGESLSLQAQASKIDKSKVTSTQVLGIRVIQDHRLGIAASESLDDDALKLLVEQALGASRYSSVDPYQLIEQKNPSDLVAAPERNNQPDDASMQDKIALTLALESEVLKRNSHIHNVPYSGYADGVGSQFYANHLGTFCYEKERSFSCYTSALAGEGSVQTMYSSSSIARRFDGLDLQHCVSEAAETAVHLLKGKPLSTGRYDVIFDIDEWENIFGSFLSAFSAKAAMEGTAHYRDKVGQSIASEHLSIVDSPQFAEGFSYSLFDDEGVSRRELKLLDRGVLKSLFHNSATARYYKIANTGHGARGPRGSLGTSATQLVMAAGPNSEKELYTGTLLKVIGLKGLHSGTNAVSGHFSLAVEGILLKDGQPQQYVKDVTLSGNFYQLLQQVLAVGQKVEASSGRGFFSPAIRFGGLSVAGI